MNEFFDVVLALDAILELRDGHVDIEILGMLVCFPLPETTNIRSNLLVKN